MSEKVKELAKQYYPILWSKERLNTLLNNAKLTQDEYNEVVNGCSSN